MSKEYIAAVSLILVSVLKGFGVEIQSDVIESLIVGGIAVYLAFKRHARGDISLAGVRK